MLFKALAVFALRQINLTKVWFSLFHLIVFAIWDLFITFVYVLLLTRLKVALLGISHCDQLKMATMGLQSKFKEYLNYVLLVRTSCIVVFSLNILA